MKKIILFILILSSINAQMIKNFTSDGCSMFVDGTANKPNLWLKCCIRHDVDYWMGGSWEERIVADKIFEKCIDNTGTPAMGRMMYLGVRIGGAPYLFTPFRWGYGWDYGRWYQKRTKKEQEIVDNLKLGWPIKKR